MESPQPSCAPELEPVRILQANCDDALHARAVVRLLDAYALDPAGGVTPLSDFANYQLDPEPGSAQFLQKWL